MKKYLLLVFVLLLSACQPAVLASTPTLTQLPATVTQTRKPSPTQAPTKTTTPTLTASPIPTPTFQVCCPLEDETIESLSSILVNPLVIPPNFGQDTGHHGVDFAYYRRGDRISIEGIEIFAILSGKTVLTLDDDIPYGYAILIETPLTDLPAHIQETLIAGYEPVPEDPHYRLYCPEITPPTLTGEYAVYHLYAHMQVRPEFNRGDLLTCGDKLGTVGNTGYSSNPHLHLETRLGPAGAAFTTMAHYENTNTPEQMGNYCLWRMSGFYQLFDPFILFDGSE
jgi:murein DD-endopeptidase MepM/ murein hydrolase activator NlpD